MALTPATTLVSLTAFRALDDEFFADSDSTELDLVTDAPARPQHQLSQEITISHQQPRTDLGRRRVSLQRIGSPDVLASISRRDHSSVGSTRASTRPAAPCSDRQRLA